MGTDMAPACQPLLSLFMQFFMLSLATVLAVTAMPVAAQDADGTGLERDETLSCSDLMMRILPGEYDFCIGRKQWTKGRYASALKLMHLSAGWGNKHAQAALGVIHFNGEHVESNRPLGLAWLALAAERRDRFAVDLYRSASSTMDAEEKEASLTLYEELRVRYADDIAATRAYRRFERGMREIASNPVYGVGWCIGGINNAREAVVVEGDSFLRILDSCSMASEQRVVDAFKARSDAYFGGWSGHVTTGPIEIVDTSEPGVPRQDPER